VLDSIPGGPHEIIIVDDGSRDRTLELLVEAAASDQRLTVVALSRNFGHQIAVSAGLAYARGDAVVVMDGDLQDEPEAIPRLLEQYEQGYDVVYARRVSRKEPVLLRACYHLFYRLLARMSKIELPLDAGDFALLSRRVVDEINKMGEQHRYIRGLRAWVGFRQTGVDIERNRRQSGSSKYTLRRLIGLALDGVLGFSIAPLRATTYLGIFAVAASSLYALYAILVKLLFHQSPQGFTALIVVMVFLFGLQFVVLGVIGEYVGRIFEQAKARPLYVVDRVIRADVDEGRG
jgi:dolichol-phosphate mannosyltransferase